MGSNLVALLVISGLAALLLSVPWLRTGLLIGSVGYLVYLAWRIAFSGSQINFIHKASAPGFINGVTLQAINPKAYLVNTALFTGFAFWPQSFKRDIDAAARDVQAAINAFMALSMLIVVGLALWAQR